MLIKEVRARKILDSRKEPTIEVSVNKCKASSPFGKSTGRYETIPYFKSLDNNIKLINSLKELRRLQIDCFDDLIKVEGLIKRKFRLRDAKQFGANALFALESAILKALAKSEKKELWQIINPQLNAKKAKMPVPLGNAIGGGVHSHNKNHPVFQEFLLIPKENSIKKNVQVTNKIYHSLGRIIKSDSTDDEGAWQTSLSNEQVLEVLSKFNNKIRIGIDIAGSTFYHNGYYNYGNKLFDKETQIHYINYLIDKYNLFYVEDPLNENDFKGFAKEKEKHLIVGDDLTVTHNARLKKALKEKSINAIIIKPNQNGSLLELKKIVDFCRKHKIKTILSHRSGETLDNALADYAFAFQADFIKTGIATKYRKCKLSRLIEIEKSLK